MNSSRYYFRDGCATAPRLAFAQSYWALQERSRSIDEALAHACDTGCEYLEAGLSAERMPALRRLLQEFPLRLIAQGWTRDAQGCVAFFERAKELGAVAINMHLGHAYLAEADAVRLMDEAHELAESYQLPLMLETHRGRLTQDLFRTHSLMLQRARTRIALDVSHYIVAGETFGGDADTFHALLAPLLQCAEMIHGRISNGQQIQVAPSDSDAAELTQSVWEQAMALWLRNAPRDAVFVFEPELGPPPYAMLIDGVESSSRDAESVALCDMARAAWRAALQRGLA